MESLAICCKMIGEARWSFSSIEVDYLGPALVCDDRNWKKANFLFACHQPRTVCLEVTFTLAAESFIIALMRSVGRRAAKRVLYTGNGTNFFGCAL